MAADGEKGLGLFESDPADIVICDIMMPRKDGVETIIELRRRFPSTRIIAMSGGGLAKNLDFLEFAKKSGRREFYPSPSAVAIFLARWPRYWRLRPDRKSSRKFGALWRVTHDPVVDP